MTTNHIRKDGQEVSGGFYRRLARILAAVALALFWQVPALGQIVYNNSDVYSGSIYNSQYEFGDEIQLSDASQKIVQFSFEYYGNFISNGQQKVILRFYANDGTDVDPTSRTILAPNTLIFESDPITLNPGYGSITVPGLSLSVPSKFTWTVQFLGISQTANDTAGLLCYNPPTVGFSYDDFWQKSPTGEWGIYRLGGNPVANFAARVQIPSANQPPTISDIADQFTTVGTPLSVNFTISDPESPADQLGVAAISSNQSLVRDADITFTGTDSVRTVKVTPQPGVTGSVTITVGVGDGLLNAIDTFVLAIAEPSQNHPADNNPTNFKIAANEISAYGAAWRRGNSWPVGPNPIPANYISRGGSLWRGGENYNVNTGDSRGAPLWWVNVVLSSQSTTGSAGSSSPAISKQSVSKQSIGKQAITDSTAAATMPSTYTAGAAFTVSISVHPDAEVTSYVVEDQVPSGWTVANIDNSGIYDANNRKVKWGLYFDNTARTLTYQITPPANATGTASFSGIASLDGVDIPITGQRTTSLAPPPTPTITIAATDASASESGPDTGTFTFTRSGSTASALTVNFAISGNAVNGTDYNSIGSNVTIPAGSSTGTVTITPIDDSSVEGSETVSLTIISGSSYAIGSPSTASLTISDNDVAPSAPIILVQPQSQTIAPGSSVTFSVNATGTAPLTYQWRFNGDPIGTATSSSLTLTGVTTAQAGSYTVLVQNGIGSKLSDAAVLTVATISIPDIATQPQSQTVTEGSSVTFSVVASGTGPFNYQWRFNGNPINNATSSTLTLNNITAAQAGGYSVVVGNSAGGITSGTATLTVNPNVPNNNKPTISAIANQLTTVGKATSPIAFTVNDTETPAASLTVAAASSNTTLVPPSGINLGGSGQSRTITLTPAANQTGATTITVSVTDGASQTTSTNFTLTVASSTTPPSISDIPDQGTAISKARMIAFTVNDVDAALNSLTFTATSSNPGVVAASGFNFGGSGKNRTVTVTPVTGASGVTTITLTVKNDAGLSASDTFLFTVPLVNEAPKISDIPNQITSAGLATKVIAFTVQDKETPASALTLAAISSNTSIAPTNKIVFGGSGTNRTVVITPQGIQSGITTITITVTDQDGGTASDSFDLTVTEVNVPPDISPVNNQTVDEDKSVTVSFLVADQENPSDRLVVTGSSSDTNIVPDTNIVVSPGSFNRTAVITPATNQFGIVTITLTVEDLGGISSSTSFELTINPLPDPPSLSPIPDQVVNEGSSTPPIAITVADPDGALDTLNLSASASNPALVPGTAFQFGGSGAARTLVITPAAGQSGNATITVTVNDGVFTASQSFQLTVNPVGNPPEITTQPQSLTVVEGTNATFTVVATGTGTLKYQWKFGDANIESATNATLTLTNVTLTQAGNYTVVVSNSAGSKTSVPAALIVNPAPKPPVIIAQPASQTAVEGTNVTFTVLATGDTPLKYQWRFNNGAITNATNSSLLLTNITLAQAGSYTVQITNALGSVTSAAAVLTVNRAPEPPTIIAPPQSQSVVIGTNVVFTVTAAGELPLTYQWRFNDTPIAGANSTNLLLTGVTTNQGGSYTVVVTNFVGSVTSAPAILTIRSATNIPPAVAIISPANGAILAAGTTIAVTASATDVDGTIAKVEFFSGATKLGEALSAPFRVNWTNVATGKYTLTARATDDRGATNTSEAVSISVKVGGPANDNFAARITLTGSSVTTNASNINATEEAGEPLHADIPGGRSVWWKWVAPTNGEVTITTTGSTFDTLLAVYTGDSFDSFTVIASNDDETPGSGNSKVTFTAGPGTNYWIAVDGFAGESGDIKLNLELKEPPKAPIVIKPPEPQSDKLTISIPVALTGYIIEVTDNLGSGIWTPLNQTPIQKGDQNIVEIVISSGAKFFRLRPVEP